jgi:hypothetical protein
MSFSRIKYDEEAYDLRLNRAVAPGDYRLFLASNENCEKCVSFDGPRNAKSDVSIAKNETENIWPGITEVESLLTNRVNKLTEYNSYGKNDQYKELSTTNKNNCKSNLISEDTRFTNPIEAYRCMDLTSYHYSPFLYVNPECEIQEDRIGLNSRLKVKDTFMVVKPDPVDQTLVLPVDESNNQVDVCKNY